MQKKTIAEQVKALKAKEAKIKGKIRQARKNVPTDIGKYIMKNFKVEFTDKSGKKQKRQIKDKEDFAKHFEVVKKGSHDVKATLISNDKKDKDKKPDKDKKDKKNKDFNKFNNNNDFNNNRF